MNQTALLKSLILFLISATAITEVSAGKCGGYLDLLEPGREFTISSPNYPNNYPIYKKCVWLYYAKQNTGFSITVQPVKGQNGSAGCLDYVTFKEHSAAGKEIITLCDTNTVKTYTTNSPILWVKFYSNHQFVNKGFEAVIKTVSLNFNNYANYTNTTKNCHLTEYKCPNSECIYHGNLCDGTNDCGCEDYNCDETICWKFPLLEDIAVNWGLGVGLGFMVILVMFIMFGLIEMREDRKPSCLKNKGHTTGCCGCFQQFKNNKVNMGKKDDMAVQKIIQSLNQGKHPLRWDSSSESDFSRSNNTSRRTSFSGSIGGSRRSSTYQAPSYGNTLSPKDVPKSPVQKGNTQVGKTLAVPKTSYA